ncbi:hypothetical protein VQ056_21615 [Paenibacillus sp. JTLBN-2024]
MTIAVLLSAQCTDETGKQVTKDLAPKVQVPEDYVAVPLEELAGHPQNRTLPEWAAKHIRNLWLPLMEQYGGEVPSEHDELVKLPGGVKTVNVVVSNAFGVPAIAVDTHVERA